MKKAFRIVLLCAYLLVLYMGFLYFFQTDFLFHPDKFYTSPAESEMTAFHEEVLTAQDGTKIMTWFYPGEKSKPVILFFHGNTGQIAGFIKQFKPFIERGYSVLAMEYRSFGNTKGEISQSDVMNDTTMAYDFLKAQGYHKIVAYGYSFGTAFASGLTSLRSLDGVILIAPFASLEQIVAEKPIPLARFLLKDTYPSVAYLRNFDKPLLIAHGKKDKVISYHHAEMLYQQAKSPQKELILSDTDSHYAIFFHPKYLQKVFAFLEAI